MILALRGLEKRFGGLTAVDQVDVSVEEGAIHAVIGPNGAGKTTLLNMLSGFYQPDAGEILFRGDGIAHLPPHARAGLGIARTFQSIRLFGAMSVLDNVAAGRCLHARAGFWAVVAGTPGARREQESRRARAREELARFGLAGREEAPAGSLPYGEQRLLEIARAMATEPRLLLLDEPAAGMNASEALAMIDRIRSIRERGVTVILIEHNMRLVMEVSDRVTVLNFGRKIFEGTPAEVQGSPLVEEAYLGRSAG